MSRTAVYGITLYGTETYGYFIPPQYRVDPFVASPYDYANITLTWNKPSGTIHGFRIIKNMFGAPVDQDDGQVILDVTSGYPGNAFTDTNVTPGSYHYYGFYCLINPATDEWVRSGFAGCLMPVNYGSSVMMQDLIPNFYVNAINAQNELVQDPTGNTFLSKFIQVFGWGFDYLRTQYDTYQNVNNPWTIPLNDLYTMAAQFNININPDIHPYTLRKAIFFNAAVNQLRGTTSGISTELSALTGWNANITTGPNIMLNNDQSYCADPFFPSWSGNITYNVGEYVTSGNYFYKCISTGNYGNAPTGTSSSNTWWQAVLNTTDTTFLNNPITGGITTWEKLYPLLTNGTFTPAALSPALIQSSMGTAIVGGTVSFRSPTQQGNTVILMILTTQNQSPIEGVTFAGTAMTLAATNNDIGVSNGSDYWYVYYVPKSASGRQFNVTFPSDTLAWGYLFEVSNLGTPVISSVTANGNAGTFNSGSLTVPGSSFLVAAVMDDSNPSVSGGWTTANASGYGVGGYQFASSGSKSISGTFTLNPSIFVTGVCCFEAASIPPPPSIYEVLGVADPLNTSDFAFNSLGGSNISGSTTDIALRSLSRTPFDIATVTTTFAPDKYQVMGDGIPVPYVAFSNQWSPSVEYAPQDIVLYSNQPFMALRASKNSVPPYASPGTFTQDWVPLSFDQRFRICISAYETASSAVSVTPFVEWYDAGGNYITRVTARNPGSGSPAVPNQLCYDSFTVGAGTSISTRTTDDGGNSWTAQTGGFSVSPFSAGCVYPTATGTRSIATVNAGGVNCQVGLTFITAPDSGNSVALVLRYVSNNSYLRADQTTLKQNNGGVFTTLGTFSTPFAEGDRMLAQLNGNTVTILRNNVQVLQVTSSFNNTSSTQGIIYEAS